MNARSFAVGHIRIAFLVFGLVCGHAMAAASEQALPRASFVGVQVAPVTAEVRTRLGLPSERGALVAGTVDGGSAQALGLRADDVIVAIDGREVADAADLVAQVGRHHAGDHVTVSWMRAGEVKSAEVVMKPRPFESAPGTRTTYGAIAVDGSLRRTIVAGPPDDARHPGILYITGIGCFSQESLGVLTTEAKLLQGLARAGYVTMRVEKSGVGDSQGPACDSPKADLQAEIAGYVAGVEALKALPGVDPSHVYLLGLSIGGVEAPIVAQRVPVQGLVVVNTVAKTFLEYLLQTRRRQGELKDVPYDVLERHLRLNELCNHELLVDGRAPEAILAARPDCKDYITYPAPYTFMRQWAALDLAAEWKRVDAPVLIVQGESDYVATVSDAPLLRDIIESFHPGRATLAMIPGMDHTLTVRGSMKESIAATDGALGAFQPRVLETIRDWVARQSG